LLSGAVPWPTDERPEWGLRPGVSFDLMTDEFDDTLVAVLEHGGTLVDEIESYNEQRVVTVADPDGNAFDVLEVEAGD
jgi:predicted enzyme related to lactoylglutathione lyase